MMEFLRCDSDHPDFVRLTERLDADLAQRNGREQGAYHPYNRILGISTVLLAVADGVAVGCGCFKRFDEATVEIKRMYVLPDQRGRRIAGGILAALENWARELGYRSAVLETGLRQAEAMRLYERCGYARTEKYGPYANMENSVCYRKSLETDG